VPRSRALITGLSRDQIAVGNRRRHESAALDQGRTERGEPFIEYFHPPPSRAAPDAFAADVA